MALVPVPADHHTTGPPATSGATPLDPDWDGDGKPVTFAFGGDVHFPSGTNLGDRLADDPSTALGPTVPSSCPGANLSMVEPRVGAHRRHLPRRPAQAIRLLRPTSAVPAFKGAGVTLITEANNHGEDCGVAGLQHGPRRQGPDGLPHPRHRPERRRCLHAYRTTDRRQKITIIAATQVIDADLQTTWTATADHPGLASAYDVNDLSPRSRRPGG